MYQTNMMLYHESDPASPPDYRGSLLRDSLEMLQPIIIASPWTSFSVVNESTIVLNPLHHMYGTACTASPQK